MYPVYQSILSLYSANLPVLPPSMYPLRSYSKLSLTSPHRATRPATPRVLSSPHAVPVSERQVTTLPIVTSPFYDQSIISPTYSPTSPGARRTFVRVFIVIINVASCHYN